MPRKYTPERARAYHLKRVYGLTPKQYDTLLVEQSNRCFVCQKHEDECKTSLAVDHDHVTLEIRGLLCNHCNRYVVGRHRDADILRRAADHLERKTGWFVPKKKRKKRG